MATQLLEMIACRNAEVLILGRIIEKLEFAKQPILKIRRNRPRSDVLHEKIAQPAIPESDDHPRRPMSYCTTLWANRPLPNHYRLSERRSASGGACHVL